MLHCDMYWLVYMYPGKGQRLPWSSTGTAGCQVQNADGNWRYTRKHFDT